MAPIRVFIFEDDWMCREAVASIIAKAEEMEVIGEAESADEGVERALRLEPDIVLMDIRLKGENHGIEATAKIVKKSPETKIIIFTNFPDEENLHAAVNAGASGYLLKKEVSDPDTILRAIRAVYKGNAFMTPAITAKILNVIRRQKKNRDYGLTKREKEILKLIGEGFDNRQISHTLDIGIRTTANHVSNILYKLHAKNRTEAALIARREGII